MPIKRTIEDMQRLAASRGGNCLSDTYVNVHTKLEWQCAKGHRWMAEPVDVKKGHWCCDCANQKRRLTILYMQELAISHQGKCLSPEYVNSKTKLEWQCKKGHRWWAVPSSIMAGTWCKICRNTTKVNPRKHTIEKMQELASERGGKCLSTVYVNVFEPLKWECVQGHIFKTSPSIIIRGSWCPECAGVKPYTVENLQRIAEERGGAFLSEKYQGIHHRYKWSCEDGHIFRKRASDIVNAGGWCPNCSTLLSERLCREILESMFEKRFPKARPKWLLNDRNNRMELDGYCEELKLAFEYQGIQHYERHQHFHSESASLERRINDDKLKVSLCRKRNITLLEIPYHISFDQLDEYIRDQCVAAGFNIRADWSKDDIDLRKAYSPKRLLEMQKIAEERGGKCLSKKYVAVTAKMRWQCAEGHIWEAAPTNIKRGSWCHRCSGQGGYTLEDAKATAEEKAGKCLSKEFKDASTTPLEWQCAKGHRWKRTYSWVLRGQWCKKCSGNEKHTLQEMQQLAKSKGGKCLSGEYKSARTPLEWECANGHRWETTPTVVLRSAWCRKCAAISKRHTIEEMREIALSKGGQCLSDEYKNSRSPLQWECRNGHKFESIPHSILRGSWCPDCGGSKKLTIEAMRKLAEQKGGKCLSAAYTSVQTELEWECERGHTWWTRPHNVLYSNTWCPDCRRLRSVKR